MSRILAIMDSCRLYRFVAMGSLGISWNDALEFSDTLPVREDYLDLLKNTCLPRRGYRRKIFLIINKDSPLNYDASLEVSISEVEFLVALDEKAQEKLSQAWPEFHFESLPPNFLKGQNYEFPVLDRQTRMGAAAAMILLGIAPAPDIISEQTLMSLDPHISDSVMMGIRLRSLKRPYFSTGYQERTLMSLVISYTRNPAFGYPDSDAGFCYDIMDIFHYLVNRSDKTPPSHDKASFNTGILNELRELCESNPDMALEDLISRMDELPCCQRIINVFSHLSDNKPESAVGYLKAMHHIRTNRGWNQNFISGLASWLRNDAEKKYFAIILGASAGFEKLSIPLFRFLSISIISDCEDPNTCIASTAGDGRLEDSNFLNVDVFERDAANPSEDDDKDDRDMSSGTAVAPAPAENPGSAPQKPSLLTYQDDGPGDSDSNPEILNVFSIDMSTNDQEFDMPEFINTDETFNGFMMSEEDDESNDAGGGSYAADGERKEAVSAAILDFESSRKEAQEEVNQGDLFTAMFPVPFTTRQKSIPPYQRASLDALSQAMQITHNMAEIADAELRDSVLSLIETEAPVRRELILARLKLLARRNKTPFRKGQEELKIQELIKEVVSGPGHSFVTDSEGFIYHRRKFVLARSRNLADSKNDSTVADYLRSPENISRAEIAAAYFVAKSTGNLLINEITPQDIIDIFHLKPRGEKIQKTADRIQEVINFLSAIPDIKKALAELIAAIPKK